jgi:hypothetical protein
MSNGANLADFGNEFGPNGVSKAMNGRGADNSEEERNKALHANWVFEPKNTSDEITYPDGPGARWTDKAYNSPNEAGK